MIPSPAEVLARISDGTLLSASVISELDHDAILDERDGDAEFEEQWTRCFKEVEAKWANADVASDLAELAENIRRESFLAVSRATAQHEIASYVSDDFDIIIRGKILDLEDEFLSGLWEAYSRNGIPKPPTGN